MEPSQTRPWRTVGFTLLLLVLLAITGPTLITKPVPFELDMVTFGLASEVRMAKESMVAASGRLNGLTLQEMERRYGSTSRIKRRDGSRVGFVIAEGFLSHHELVVELDSDLKVMSASVEWVDDF